MGCNSCAYLDSGQKNQEELMDAFIIVKRTKHSLMLQQMHAQPTKMVTETATKKMKYTETVKIIMIMIHQLEHLYLY